MSILLETKTQTLLSVIDFIKKDHSMNQAVLDHQPADKYNNHISYVITEYVLFNETPESIIQHLQHIINLLYMDIKLNINSPFIGECFNYDFRLIPASLQYEFRIWSSAKNVSKLELALYEMKNKEII